MTGGTYTLGIIGGGFMARAIAESAVKKNFLAAKNILIGEIDEAKRANLAENGFQTCSDNGCVAASSQYLLFAVKPQNFQEAAQGIVGRRLSVVLTIMAGKTKEEIRNTLGSADVKIARAMPNLPCSVGEGMTALDASELCGQDKVFAVGLFSSVGKVIETEERLLNAVTGVSGSGPAYVFLFLQSLIEAGMENGLSEEQAKILAMQTVRGGLCLAETADQTLWELIGAVSSKGGTTAAALESLKKDDFAGAVSRAVRAAAKRAEELSR